MIYNIFISTFYFFASLSFNGKTTNTPKKLAINKTVVSKVISSIDSKIQLTYNSLQTNQFDLPKQECFAEALKGFYELNEKV